MFKNDMKVEIYEKPFLSIRNLHVIKYVWRNYEVSSVKTDSLQISQFVG